MKFKDIQTHSYKSFRIYGKDLSISLLDSKVINLYFIDSTYMCIPNNREDLKSFLAIIGYKFNKDHFELVLVALLSNEDSDILIQFYNFIINAYNWNPKYSILNY